MSVSSKVTLTAELKDEISAPLAKVDKNFEQTSKRIEDANKRQGESAESAAAVIEKATARATGAQSDMEKAVARATGKRSDALHNFEQASARATIAEKRLEEARARADGGSATVLTAEKNLEAARYRQEKALHAVATATGDLEEAQAGLLTQNEELAKGPTVNPEQRNKALGTLAPAATVAGGAMSLGFGKMLNTYADFDKAMSQVKAFTQESDANMALLREAAISAGADTAYSAEEAAGAINELGKAGVSTQDILSGGLNGAMSLAAAGELAVGKAAEIAATAMTQFKLSGDQIPHLADLLAAGAGKAMGSVEDLGMALNQAGLVASATGLNIEETTGTLAAFASAGLLGSDAGTSMKTMLQRLSNPSKEASKEMEKLGINMYDANGEFAGMDVLAGQLAQSLGNKSSAERDAAMATIFGSDAVRAANVLYEQGAEGIQEWTDKVNDAGYAAKTAADLQDNLAGDLEKLGGSIDTVFLQSGSAANDILRFLVQGLEWFVDTLGSIPAPILNTLGILTGLSGGALLVAGAVGMALPKIVETKDALRVLAPEGGKASNALGQVDRGMRSLAKGAAVAGAIMAVGVGIGKLAEMSYSGNIIQGTGHIAVALQEIINKGPAAKGALDAAFKGVDGGGVTASIGSMDDAITQLFADDPGTKFDRFGQKTVNALTGIKGSQQIAEDAFGGIDAELGALVSSGNIDGASDAFRQIQEKLDAAGVSTEDAAYLFPQYSDALSKATAASGEAADGADTLAGKIETVGQAAGPSAEELEAMEESLAEMGITLDGVIGDMTKFLDLLFATGLATMSSRDAQASYQDALRGIDETVAELIEKNGSLSGVLNQNKTDFDLTTVAGATANSAFQDLARGGMDQVKAMANEGLGQDKLQEKLSGTYTDLVNAADAFGITGKAGEDLARNILGIPDGVSIDSWMSETAKRTAEETAGVIAKLDGSTAHVWITTHKQSIYSETHRAATYTGSDGLLRNQAGRGGQTVNSGGGVYLAGGGVMPGYAPGVDDIPAVLSRGEAVLVPELVRAMGPSNIMALNHLYSGGRPAGGGPARASMADLVARFAGGGIPDTVPNAWVDEFKPNTAPASAPPSLAPSPSRGRSGGNITLNEGAVQVAVPAGTGLDPDELGRIVQEAVTAALEAKQEKMEQAY